MENYVGIRGRVLVGDPRTWAGAPWGAQEHRALRDKSDGFLGREQGGSLRLAIYQPKGLCEAMDVSWRPNLQVPAAVRGRGQEGVARRGVARGALPHGAALSY